MLVKLREPTLRSLLDRTFDLHASLPSLAYAGETPCSYAAMKEIMESLAGLLMAQEVSKGERVALLGDNSPSWVHAYLTLVSMGRVAIPILTGFTRKQVHAILDRSRCAAAFVAQKQMEKIEGSASRHLRAIFSLDDFSLVGGREDTDSKPSSFMPFESLPRPSPKDVAAIIHTSGTTGNSKGVILTHENITSNVLHSIEQFPIDHHDRFLSILPLSHTFEATGGMLCPIAAGSSIHYMKGLPTPARLLDAMGRVKPTAVLAVPLLMEKIYKKQILPGIRKRTFTRWLFGFPFTRPLVHRKAGARLLALFGGHLRFFMFGGASLSEEVERFLKEAGIQYATGYGLTESSPILTINPFGKVKLGSVGLPIPGVEVKVLFADPKTGIGEIVARGPNIMAGYADDETASAHAFTRDGWLKTGDLGFLDEDGYLFLKGRSKNVIVKASGENIYPESVEELLLQDPAVLQALVCESEGKLVAQIHLDETILQEMCAGNESGETRPLNDRFVRDYIENLKRKVNLELPAFSRLNEITLRTEPFETTPTQKIKRYLYVKQAGANIQEKEQPLEKGK